MTPAEIASAPAAVAHADLANAIRALAMDAVEQAKSGHPGMPMGMADVATVLFTRFLKFDPESPDWPDRDRFVLSAGHGSMLLYAVLHLTGYADLDLDQIRRFRQLGSRTPGHPEHGHAGGVETTTGPLGQGLASAVGMALAERLLAARFGAAVVDHSTYVIASDGDLMEGISHEAMSLAGHLGLAKLVVLFDDNGISIDGPTSLAVSDDHVARARSYGWSTWSVDGHDPEAVAAAITAARAGDRPAFIACRTTIAYGAPKKAGTAGSHGAPLGAEEVAGARAKLGWPHPPFAVPAPILDAWRAVGRKGAGLRRAWERRLAALPAERAAAFRRGIAGDLPQGWQAALAAYATRVRQEKPSWATRKASQEVLEVLTAAIPELIGGSADLTGSVLTKTKATAAVTRTDMAGRYVYYGVREHAMVAAMNGIALHRGLIPYGGTFLVFSDYCRPALRLAALMGQRVIFVGTHDSIGLGEDGPTHQPVEHLASLRAMPNVLVFRPADAIETAECWALALATTTGPSVIALTRQNVPLLRTEAGNGNRSARGGYVLAEAERAAQVTLLATGSEVALAIEARAALEQRGIGARVVSLPCWELFDAQEPAYRQAVLGVGTIRIGIEAAGPFGWERYLGAEGAFIGMTGFGASAPSPDLYRHFGITAEAVVARAEQRLAERRQ